MSRTVIHVENLSKSYRVGERQRYLALRDVLARLFMVPFQRLGSKGKTDWLWALRDVSFDVRQGEVIGLVGRNGAGKTTLLKILSRITRPTSGFAEIHGRVGSLLEVGTGFHPELTGKENVYLSGAVLGMRKSEIRNKFDVIVEFAGVERFIDTPLKHFSTGMQMRLAFAVAAHLEPEILLVDEVLAVGDLEFQKKCLGKMEQVSNSGRTIVFVSHQMNQIRRLCGRALWIDDGKIRKSGSANQIVGEYESEMSSGIGAAQDESRQARKTRFTRWAILGSVERPTTVLASTGRIRLGFEVLLSKPLRMGHHGIALYNNARSLIWGTAMDNLELPEGTHTFVHELPSLPVRPGPYTWRVSLYDEHGLLDDWQCAPEMMVITAPVTHPNDEWAGLLNIPTKLSILSGKNKFEPDE
jgi:ABC-type polysaccharide/polyol phosphate transport system ATPase subunit